MKIRIVNINQDNKIQAFLDNTTFENIVTIQIIFVIAYIVLFLYFSFLNANPSDTIPYKIITITNSIKNIIGNNNVPLSKYIDPVNNVYINIAK